MGGGGEMEDGMTGSGDKMETCGTCHLPASIQSAGGTGSFLAEPAIAIRYWRFSLISFLFIHLSG
jgi:hypothetical protein